MKNEQNLKDEQKPKDERAVAPESTKEQKPQSEKKPLAVKRDEPASEQRDAAQAPKPQPAFDRGFTIKTNGCGLTLTDNTVSPMELRQIGMLLMEIATNAMNGGR